MKTYIQLVWLAGALLLGFSHCALGQATVYTWNPSAFYNETHPTSPFPYSTDWVSRPGNAQSLRVTVPSTASTSTFYNFLTVPAGTLQSGQQYTAKLTFEVSTATGYPRCFYMFARNTAGEGYDLWRNIIDDPGHPRTESFVIDLPTIGTGNTWSLCVGMHGPASIIVDSFKIVSGSGCAAIVAPKAGTPTSILPAGVTAATGATAITITPPAPTSTTVISPTDYGLVADGSSPATSVVAAANATALQNALNACKTQGAAKLVFPAGTYRINESTNIVMNALNDMVIDGQGAQLIFGKLRVGSHFTIQNCARLMIKNLFIDWDSEANPIASLAQVNNFVQSRNTASFDLSFTDLNAAQTLKREDPSVKWLAMAQYNYSTLVRTDPNKNVCRKVAFTFSNTVGNTCHVSATPFKPTFTNGQYYCIRHLYYDTVAFKVVNSNNVLFDAVTIYSNPGMGWLLVSGANHVKLLNCKIERRLGSRNPYTSAADGFHADQTKGDIDLTGCFFTGLGDDSINIHNHCWQGGIDFSQSNDANLRFLHCALRIAPGDVLKFFDADYSPLNIALTVKSLKSAPDGKGTYTCDVTFTTPVPKTIPRLAIMCNQAYEVSNVHINKCTFQDTNARAILISADGATIEDNYFHHVFSSPIQLHTEIVDDAWAEGSGANNIVIRGNTFENNNDLGKWDGAEIHAGPILPWGMTAAPLFKTILVENNSFWNSPGPSAAFQASQNVIVRTNTVHFSENRPTATQYAGSLFATYSSLLGLGGNTWSYLSSGLKGDPAVVYDPPTVFTLGAQTNLQNNQH